MLVSMDLYRRILLAGNERSPGVFQGSLTIVVSQALILEKLKNFISCLSNNFPIHPLLLQKILDVYAEIVGV